MSTAADEAAARARNLRTVSALAALFVLPLALSFWMYYGGAWRPAGHSNHGELIDPARPLPQARLPDADGGSAIVLFRDRWTLVYVGHGACDAACRRALLVMRQVRLALNNDMTRVDRVLLATDNCCDRAFLAREHAGLSAFDASGEAARPLIAQFPATDREHSLFIVDPLGNLLMRYDARWDPKGLLDDLKKLLKLSHIG
ncbi:MAG: hypothetical protein ACRETT_07120 [Steroidobacteraceae bacterium]